MSDCRSLSFDASLGSENCIYFEGHRLCIYPTHIVLDGVRYDADSDISVPLPTHVRLCCRDRALDFGRWRLVFKDGVYIDGPRRIALSGPRPRLCLDREHVLYAYAVAPTATIYLTRDLCSAYKSRSGTPKREEGIIRIQRGGDVLFEDSYSHVARGSGWERLSGSSGEHFFSHDIFIAASGQAYYRGVYIERASVECL